MSQAPSVRPLTAADEAGWKALWRAFLADVEETASDEEVDRAWATLMDPAKQLFGLVAVCEGRLAGFLLYAPIAYPRFRGSACYLVDLSVDGRFRRRGLARALIEALAEIGRSAGWSHIFWMTQPDNHAARSLYASLGRQIDLVRYDLPLLPETIAGKRS